MKPVYIELQEKFSRLQWLLQRNHLRNHATKGPMGNPTRGQGRVIAMLKIQPDISSKDLSYLLGIRQQSLNELLAKLEKNGYITRTPSEEDKRVMIIHLTEKGKEAKIEEEQKDNIFSSLNEEEQATLSGYLDRIIGALEEKVGESEEEFEEHFNHMRSRMSKEQLEQFMRMRGRFYHHGYGKRKKHSDEEFECPHQENEPNDLDEE